MEKINVLHIIREAEGGMKKHVESIVKGLDKEKFKTVLICSKGQYPEKIRPEVNLHIYEMNIGDRQKVGKMLALIRQIAAVIESHSIDIIHNHGIAAAIIGSLAGVAKNCSIVSTIHNFPNRQTTCLKQILTNWAAQKLLSYNEKVLVVSQALRLELAKSWSLPAARMHLVYNGVEIADILQKSKLKGEELPIPGDGKIILTIARLIPDKGVDDFIRAAAVILHSPQEEKYVFWIAGNGPEKDYLQNLSCELGVMDNMVFLGFRQDIYPLITKCDAVVLASKKEGLGLALLEAMVLRKPVIATQTGGIPEVISPGHTGRLVPPASPDLLARTIVDVFRQDAETSVMIDKAFQKVTEVFSREKMLRDIEQIYADLVKK
ncbi:MAG: glycosyltransferase [Peptococcaceae bacterium]